MRARTLSAVPTNAEETPVEEGELQAERPVETPQMSMPVGLRLLALASLAVIPLNIVFLLRPNEVVSVELIDWVTNARTLALNVTALASLLVLIASLFDLAKFRDTLSTPRRMSALVYSAGLTTITSIALFTPPENDKAILLPLLAMFSAAPLMWLLDNSIRTLRPRASVRVTTVAASASVTLGFVAHIAWHVPSLTDHNAVIVALPWISRIAEALWLIAPWPILLDAALSNEKLHWWRAISGWTLAVILLGPVFLIVASSHALTASWFLRASSVSLLSTSRAVLIYPALFLTLASLALANLFQRNRTRAHLGAIAAIWLTIGVGPETPVAILEAAVAFMLLFRVAAENARTEVAAPPSV